MLLELRALVTKPEHLQYGWEEYDW